MPQNLKTALSLRVVLAACLNEIIQNQPFESTLFRAGAKDIDRLDLEHKWEKRGCYFIFLNRTRLSVMVLFSACKYRVT